MTGTAKFAIGFRRGWSEWQQGNVEKLSSWAKGNGFAALDLMNITPDDVRAVEAAGLRVGSVDLLDMDKIMSNDDSQRKAVIARNVEHVRGLSSVGVKAFFTCVIPADSQRSRKENYALAVDCFAPIAHACHEHGAAIAVEGWPGMPPYYSNLCCTPESMRAFIRDLDGKGVGVNYDPSHLIRLGVDHIRFLREFAPHVKHVHAKDTAIDRDALYEFGTQSAAFAAPHGFGEWTWRYTLPGHGEARWGEIFSILRDGDYRGIVSIELEDENFNGSEEREKAALQYSRNFLVSC